MERKAPLPSRGEIPGRSTIADHELAQHDRRLLDEVAQLAGVDRVWVTDETLQGESRSTFAVAAGGEEFVVKLVPAAGQAIDNQLRLVRIVRDLRQRGYPAPEYVGVGESSGTIFTLQRRLPGQPLHRGAGAQPAPGLFAAVLPSLLAAVDLQRDAGDLARPPWPAWLLGHDRGGRQRLLPARHYAARRPARPRCSAACSRWPGATSGTKPGRGMWCTST